MSLLREYEIFVDSKLSDDSKFFDTMMESLENLRKAGFEHNVRIPELITASVGLPAEAGEFTEIVKKMMFQGKPLNEENKIHLIKELGDLMFYAMVACQSLGVTADEVIAMNREKLEARYKDGFSVDESEHRVEGDI